MLIMKEVLNYFTESSSVWDALLDLVDLNCCSFREYQYRAPLRGWRRGFVLRGRPLHTSSPAHTDVSLHTRSGNKRQDIGMRVK